jgi:hypothetical protein
VSELANMRAFVKELASESAFEGREETPETEEEEAEEASCFGLLIMKICRIRITHERVRSSSEGWEQSRAGCRRRTLKSALRSSTSTSPAMNASAMPRSPEVTSRTQNASERTLIATLGPPL